MCPRVIYLAEVRAVCAVTHMRMLLGTGGMHVRRSTELGNLLNEPKSRLALLIEANAEQRRSGAP
jgi:hypothetical protein